MKAQIKVGEGDGKVANIPGYTDAYNEYQYERKSFWKPGIIFGSTTLVFGFLLSVIIAKTKTLTKIRNRIFD